MTKPQTPTDGDALVALALRVEAASGPDNVLNRAIARAIGWGYQTPSEARRKNPAWFHPDDCRDGKPVIDSLHGTDVWREPLPYLTSLDAAMTLVPEFALFMTRTVWDGDKTAGIATISQYEDRKEGDQLRRYWLREHEACAATPALALCAAALRALAARQDAPEADRLTSPTAQGEG